MAKTQQQLNDERAGRIDTVKAAADKETTRVHANAAKGKALTSVTMEGSSDIDGEQRTFRLKATSGIESEETGPAPAATPKDSGPKDAPKPASSSPAPAGGDKK